jgi:hypothetical protein
LLYTAPLLFAALAFRVATLVRDSADDLVGLLGIVAFTLALIAGLTALLLRRQKRRAVRVAGQRWFSRSAFYPGPYDEDDNGFEGSAEFARRHKRNATAPVVRLVLTPTAIEVVPMQGRNRPLICELADIDTVDVTNAGRGRRGITITRRDGRAATFLVRPDPSFVDQLSQVAPVTTSGAWSVGEAWSDPTATRSSRRNGAVFAAIFGGYVVAIAFGVWLGLHTARHSSIRNTPGYATFSGPNGKPLAAGQPWGRPCQPVRFAVEEHVPDWVYVEMRSVVSEARRDGIDVVLESRSFTWDPGSLYYPPGLSAAQVPEVAAFVDEKTPKRSNGKPERVRLGWDARLDAGRKHEYVTFEQAVFHLPAITGDLQATRRSARQLIAFTQGIISSTRSASGIRDGSSVDRFTASDVAAMKLMSGCGDAPASVVARDRS